MTGNAYDLGMEDRRGLGPVGFRISATGSSGLDWQRLDATWAVAGEQDVLSAGWLSDHLSDASAPAPRSRPSPRPPLPGNRAGDVAYFVEKRDVIRRALEGAGRDPADFTFAAHVDCGSDARSRTEALDVARAMPHAGADHIILGIPASGAPQALAPMAHEVAQPLMESF